MTRGQRMFIICLWCIAALALLGLITTAVLAKRSNQRDQLASLPPDAPEPRLAPLFDSPQFSLTDQNGKTFTLDDLKGHVWIADFIFTSCPGACPIMTEKMASLQQTVPEKSVHFVSFSLDPDHDKPPVLKKYASEWKADESRWHFLVGDATKIYNIARGMKVSALPATPTSGIVHSEKFILVDGAGTIRGYYDSNVEKDIKRLIADANDLASGKVATPAAGGA